MKASDLKRNPVEEAIREHIARGVPFSECMFRPGSEAFTEFYTRVREMRESLNLDWQDQELLDTDIGECIMVEGERVPLDVPIEEEVELDEEWRDYSNNPKYNVEVPAEKRNWQIITLAEPEKQNPNPTHFLARIEHKSKNIPAVTGKGNTQGAAIEDAYKKMLAQIGMTTDRSDNPDDFTTFTADLNADFTNEYLSKFSVPFYKFVEESGHVFLVQASKEYYHEFGDEISQLGFTQARDRIVNREGNATPIFGFNINKNIVKSLGLRPNGRYTLEYVNDDSDGNAMFRLPQQADSVVLSKHDKYRMGVPGVTIAATPKDIKEAEYQGRKVKLNSPKRGGPKKFYVYVKNPKTGRVKKISWGDTSGLSVKAKDRGAVRSFVARHKCKQKNDKMKAGYWACRTPRYKALGVKGGAWW